MQPRGGLVEHVHGAPRGDLCQFGGQLHTLGLAARQRGGRLAQADVIEPHVVQRLQAAAQALDGGEELHGLLNAHIQHVVDGLALVVHVEGLAVVALAPAHLARHIHVGQEVHLDGDGAVALAGFAPPTLHVEREPPRGPSAGARVGGH